jgi:tight adherence protein C
MLAAAVSMLFILRWRAHSASLVALRNRRRELANDDDQRRGSRNRRGQRRKEIAIRVPNSVLRACNVSTPTEIRVRPTLVVALLLLTIAAPPVAAAAVMFGVAIPRLRRRGRERERVRQCNRAIPDLVDLIRLVLESGCSPHTAFALLSRRADGPLTESLQRIGSDLHNGVRFVDALETFRNQIGPAARPLCSALLASERYGLPLSATLETLALDARLARQREAELAARRLPVLLLFPLVLCILPAFALLSIVPLLGGGLSALHW